MVLCAPDPGPEEVVEMLKTRGSMMDSEIPLPLIDLRTQESVGSGGVRQKLVCVLAEGPRNDTVWMGWTNRRQTPCLVPGMETAKQTH